MKPSKIWATFFFAILMTNLSYAAPKPSAPSGVTATAGDSKISLKWNNIGNATGYNIKQSLMTGGPYAKVGQTLSPSFTHQPLTNGVKYFYVITAYNKNGESNASSEVSATPVATISKPQTPTGLSANATTSEITLSWNPSQNANTYLLKKSSNSSGPFTTIVEQSGTTFSDSQVSQGNRYYYVVSAKNTAGESLDSSSISATLIAPSISFSGGIPILVDSTESLPVQKAVADLQRDLQTLFGVSSSVINALSQLPTQSPAIIVSGKLNGVAHTYRDAKLSGKEAHSVRVVMDSDATPRLVLSSTGDDRGAIFSIYTFSEEILGFSPLHRFLSSVPSLKTQLTVNRDFYSSYSSPSIPWRIAYPNDQDLFNFWENKETLKTELLIETLLRLKFNVLDIGRELSSLTYGLRWARVARDRGMAIATEHQGILGGSFSYWSKIWTTYLTPGIASPTPTLANTADLDRFWKWHIDLAASENLEMIWTLGLRGTSDTTDISSFFTETSTWTDAQKASAIQSMINHQINLLDTFKGAGNWSARIVLWAELEKYFQQGLINLPLHPSIKWVYSNDMREHVPPPELLSNTHPYNQPIGYYFHHQFTSTGAHISDAEGPQKFEYNLKAVWTASPSRFDLVEQNVGNVREFPLSLTGSSIMSFDRNQTATSSLYKTIFTIFGSDLSGSISQAFNDYLNAFWQMKASDVNFPRQYIFQDLRTRLAMNSLLKRLVAASTTGPVLNPFNSGTPTYFNIDPAYWGATNQLDAVIAGMTDSISKFELLLARVRTIKLQVTEDRMNAYKVALEFPVLFALMNQKTLLALSKAMKAGTDITLMKSYLTDALKYSSALDQDSIKSAFLANQIGIFTNWYGGDSFYDSRYKLDYNLTPTDDPALVLPGLIQQIISIQNQLP